MFSSLKNAENSLIILKNLERHHSISKSHHSSTCSRFKGIFVHSDDIFSRKFLHEICSNLRYLSIATWITQFGPLWTKLSSKQENCSNLKSCNSSLSRLVKAVTSRDRKNPWHVDDSWMVHDSWQKGRWMTRAWFTTRDRRQGSRLVHTLTSREHSKLAPFSLRSFNLHSSKSKTRSKHLSRLKTCIKHKNN